MVSTYYVATWYRWNVLGNFGPQNAFFTFQLPQGTEIVDFLAQFGPEYSIIYLFCTDNSHCEWRQQATYAYFGPLKKKLVKSIKVCWYYTKCSSTHLNCLSVKFVENPACLTFSMKLSKRLPPQHDFFRVTGTKVTITRICSTLLFENAGFSQRKHISKTKMSIFWQNPKMSLKIILAWKGYTPK